VSPTGVHEPLLLIGVVALPLAMAVALASPLLRERAQPLAPLAALPALGLALFGAPGSSLEIPWLLKHTVLAMDETGRVFLAFTSALYLAAAWYASSYLKSDPHPTRFVALLLLAMAGNFGLILAGDVPTFYLGFALMGLASAGLVLQRGDAEAVRAGRIYLALTMVGEVLIFSGFGFLVVSAGTTEIAELHRGVFSRPALLLLMLGFGIKAGALTLHFWLPLAHPAAPIPASAVLSGAMIKAGLLGWIRFLPLGEAAMPAAGFALISAGLGAAFLGTLVGAVQRNPKTVLAYSSISQMGIITTGLGIGALQPEAWLEIQTAVLIYATHHALSKGALFLGIGPAQMAHTRLQVATARVGLLLPALALAGAPFTSGALAKVALKSNLVFLPGGWASVLEVLLPLAAVGTTLKMARFLWLTWPRRAPAAQEYTEGLWPPWLCLVAAVLAGVWLLPGALGLLPAKLTPQKLWLATWPLLVGGGLAALGAWLRRWVSGDPSRWLPAGDVGVLLEKLVAGSRPRTPARPAPDHGHEHGESSATGGSSGYARTAALGVRLGAIERRLSHWPVAGFALLVSMGLLLWLLTGPGS
jgi:formate hydrogenlyase subunit 3/multisubunit Na+/H+ antiporter MnhD subunit